MNNLLSTQLVVNEGEYYSTGSLFFSNFSEAWKTVNKQVLKLETRQNYQEPDNKSLSLLLETNDLKASVDLLEEARKVDIPLYTDLKFRKIDFIRCRPVAFPLTQYMRWELECYAFNSKHCENVFLTNINNVHELFNKLALHDFMIFDKKVAFIHNYNSLGLIEGGWKITNPLLIENLLIIFSIIKAQSISFESFLLENNISIFYS